MRRSKGACRAALLGVSHVPTVVPRMIVQLHGNGVVEQRLQSSRVVREPFNIPVVWRSNCIPHDLNAFSWVAGAPLVIPAHKASHTMAGLREASVWCRALAGNEAFPEAATESVESVTARRLLTRELSTRTHPVVVSLSQRAYCENTAFFQGMCGLESRGAAE